MPNGIIESNLRLENFGRSFTMLIYCHSLGIVVIVCRPMESRGLGFGKISLRNHALLS